MQTNQIMPKDFKQLGSKGESLVADKLQQDGYTLLAQNYTTRTGEIDVIAMKNEVIAFVEVKLRRSQYFQLSQVIVPSKQRKIIKTAKLFIARNNFGAKSYRFDVALVEKQPTADFEITYIPNAFTESHGYY